MQGKFGRFLPGMGKMRMEKEEMPEIIMFKSDRASTNKVFSPVD